MSSRLLDRFANNIRKLMDKNKVTSKQLAAGSGLTRATTDRILNQLNSPNLTTIENVAKFFDVSVSSLLRSEEETNHLTNGELLDLLSIRLEEQLKLGPNLEKIFRILEKYDDDQLKDVLKKIKDGGKHVE